MSHESYYFTLRCEDEHVGTLSASNNSWLRKNVINAYRAYFTRQGIKVYEIELCDVDIDDIINGIQSHIRVDVVKSNGKTYTTFIDIEQTYLFF